MITDRHIDRDTHGKTTITLHLRTRVNKTKSNVNMIINSFVRAYIGYNNYTGIKKI